MNCPVCGGRTIGKVGVGQYYCWDCCIEFTTQADKVVIYDLAEDGSLVAWEDPVLGVNGEVLNQNPEAAVE
ncbi:MAG: hypothetical protein QMC95_08160 [Desulfitobacteriaceae bacterium]|nr:hypothetical protein [Desulfitobacteriaceae bacterium]MDI6878012.1 hypothetical protein [Desulfitobacteriaceae bacterium]MDI6914183.1 hypothetical protein [Desulfitobacteriaceae bacterium]